VTVKGFKKCCIFHEVDGREDKKEVEKIGSEHEDVSSEDTEAETANRNGEQSETAEGE
jgi:hypothetical protein